MRKRKPQVDGRPKVYRKSPEALERPPAQRSSVDNTDGIIVYGEKNDLPQQISIAVQNSPTTTACLDTVAQFIKGAGFNNKVLMDLKVNKIGQTLWDIHCAICDTLALFGGFSVNFKYNENFKITNLYVLPFELCRLGAPVNDESTEIKYIKYNPFFGTTEYNPRFTKTYPTFNNSPDVLNEEMFAEEWFVEVGDKKVNKYPGQVYYYGKQNPLSLYYPIPKYWAGKSWIKVDGEIQSFHANNLKNGFFQSVLMNMIGDPNKKSNNPKYKREVVGEDGVIRTESTKTRGEEFDEFMSENFAGSEKSGTALVLWAMKQEEKTDIQPFPSNINADLFEGTLRDTIRGITIATGTPSVLANLPQQESSLGSDGNAIQAAIELMQSRVKADQNTVMQFLNETILPNLEVQGYTHNAAERLEIVNFTPVSAPVDIEDKFWEVLSDQEKRMFIKDNFQNIKLVEAAPATQGLPAAPPQEVNENLKNLTGRQLQGIQRIVKKFNKSEITFEQAADMLKSGFGFTDEQVNNWLITTEEE